jgi:hypothetical protein
VDVHVVYEYCECVWILYCQCVEFLVVELVYLVSIKKIQANLQQLGIMGHRRLTYAIYEGWLGLRR